MPDVVYTYGAGGAWAEGIAKGWGERRQDTRSRERAIISELLETIRLLEARIELLERRGGWRDDRGD